jgi:Peptidase family M28
MEKILLCILLLGNISLKAQIQTMDPIPFAATIQANDLKKILYVLTSDSLEGRETGTTGNQKAANFIAEHFKKLGLPPVADKNTYFQRMVYTDESWDDIGLKVNNEAWRHIFNFYALPGDNNDMPFVETDRVLFLGYGIDDPKYSDYRGESVDNQVIMIYKGEPVGKDSQSLITGNRNLSDWSTDIYKKLKVAHQKGVKAVLIIDNELAKNVSLNRSQLSRHIVGEPDKSPKDLANHLYISPDIAKAIIGTRVKKFERSRRKMAQGKPCSRLLYSKLQIRQKKYFNQLISNNVVGYIEGSDPILKKELVIVSAHYDHLGKRGQEIFRGADDNASGTSTVMEIAEALQTAKKEGKGTKRSVMCLLMTGEERGLLGSNYYVKYPLFPINQTIANVNVDMVGRCDEKHKANPNYIYVIGADKLSTELDTVVQQVNQQYENLELDYTYNDPADPNRYYYRSDHYNFAEKGIPAVFYFNGTHDDYHRSTDTPDKILFDKMARVGKLAFHTVWALANRNERLKIDVKVK